MTSVTERGGQITSAIEQGRESLIEKEERNKAYQEIFETGIRILEAKGELERGLIVFKRQVLRHRVNSATPTVEVKLSAGSNLDKARKVRLFIEGKEGSLQVTRIGNRKNNKFQGFSVDSFGGFPSLEYLQIEEVRAFLAGMQQLESEVLLGQSE